MIGELPTLGADGLLRFKALEPAAANAVTDRLFAEHGSFYERLGPRGRDACRAEIAFHLDFLQPVLEFGHAQPMADYLVWLRSVLESRSVPKEHLARSLDWLAEFFAENLDAADSAVVGAALRAARAQLVAGADAPHFKQRSRDAWLEALAFEAALLEGRRREALDVVGECLDGGRSLVETELHVIAPSLHRIGEKWQLNQVTIAQEHMATSIAQWAMTSGLLRSSPRPTTGKRIVLACVENNHHAVGLQMASDAFQLAGWDVDYLGANVPTSALAEHVSERNPDLVGLSVSFTQQLRSVRDLIARLTTTFGPARPPVVVGGRAINRYRQMARIVEADAYCADAQAAVDYASGGMDERPDAQ
jgi:methanogenic corrinoid protein MtbC1